MADFNEINNALNNEEVEEEKAIVKVELVTLSGLQNYEVEEGTTIREFKEAHGLSADVKIVDEDGDVLRADDEITDDISLFTSTPKKNG